MLSALQLLLIINTAGFSLWSPLKLIISVKQAVSQKVAGPSADFEPQATNVIAVINDNATIMLLKG